MANLTNVIAKMPMTLKFTSTFRVINPQGYKNS